jgi:hypothetical protein
MVKLLILPQEIPTLSCVSVACSPSKTEQSSILCRIGKLTTGGKVSVQDVVSTTLERQKLVRPNLPQVHLHLQILCCCLITSSVIPGHASASVQITPVAQPAVSCQDIQKAIAEAQRRGIKSIICRNTSDPITPSYRSESPRPYGSTTWFDGTTTCSKSPKASRHPQIHDKPRYMAESFWLQTH